jgi:hypothetical protein
MKTSKVIETGLVGLALEVSIPEMIVIANVKAMLDKVLTDNLREVSTNADTTLSFKSKDAIRDKYRSNSIYLTTEIVVKLSTLLGKMSGDILSLDAAMESVFGEEEDVKQSNN